MLHDAIPRPDSIDNEEEESPPPTSLFGSLPTDQSLSESQGSMIPVFAEMWL